MPYLTIIGGGLAGSEAAWQAAERGIEVKLYEMRPAMTTGAHITGDLAELVCSNSLGSNLPDRASGLLKEEMRRMGSLLISCADDTAVPAGGALAVDRTEFSKLVTRRIEEHPCIEVVRDELGSIPDKPVIISSGPLTSESLSSDIARLSGEDRLYFYDAISPIVHAESIDMNIAFRASRHGRGTSDTGDYINCPMTRTEYDEFMEALLGADRIPLRSFEEDLKKGVRAGAHAFFEGCLPVEIMAERGRESLAYGPLRPVGLIDPRIGKRPYAAVQLRQDNISATLYNIVGFQTNLKFPEQSRVLRMIPGLERAEFLRYGQMHRNTFIASPQLLKPSLQYRNRDDIFFAGQITGVEGYAGNIATGLLAGINAALEIQSAEPIELPVETMLGALCHYIANADLADFQPMKANFGILPRLENARKLNKRDRADAYRKRALETLDSWLTRHESVFLKNDGVIR